jgi:hypothetical protein
MPVQSNLDVHSFSNRNISNDTQIYGVTLENFLMPYLKTEKMMERKKTKEKGN